MRKDEVKVGMGKGLEGLGVQRGLVREIAEMKEFGSLLGGDETLLTWWRVGMGFVRDREV
jgi:hypothetical protein